MRKKIFAANWKMNKSPQEAQQFIGEFLALLPKPLNSTVIVFPPTIDIAAVSDGFKSSPIFWGAQNCHFEKAGAFTGETSPQILSQLGAKYVLVGHSERRTLFKEDNELLAKKLKSVQAEGMTPMLCVGETLQERESNKTEFVIKEQLLKGLAQAIDGAPFTVAYEPVWAIGTGKVAEPHQAEEAHRFLRSVLAQSRGDIVAANTAFLYGGSVTAQNCRELIALPNIDGFLVGGASLKPSSFITIVMSNS